MIQLGLFDTFTAYGRLDKSIAKYAVKAMQAWENYVPRTAEAWNRRRYCSTDSWELKKLVEEQSVLVEWGADKSLVCRNGIAEPPMT